MPITDTRTGTIAYDYLLEDKGQLQELRQANLGDAVSLFDLTVYGSSAKASMIAVVESVIIHEGQNGVSNLYATFTNGAVVKAPGERAADWELP